jgi:hypothetical protein
MLIKLLGLLTFAVALPAAAQQNQEYARYDAATLTWEFRMQPESTEGDVDWVTYHYVERHHIKPKVKSTLKDKTDGLIYSYRIANGRSATQIINYIYASAPITSQVPDAILPSAAELNSSPELMRAWQLRKKAQNDARQAIKTANMSMPTGWRSAMRIGEDKTGFGWFPEIEPYGPGVPPGKNADGFELRRPELPGAVLAKMQGRVEEPALPSGYKPGGAVEQAIIQILAKDNVYAPILAPAITLPFPYNAAEHARRLKAHVQTWLGNAEVAPLISQDMLDRLNRNLDSLTQAAEYNNKSGVRSAFTALLTDVFGHHRGMSYKNAEEDDDDNDADALPQHEGVANSRFSSERGMHRIAARALTFNLMYLLKRVGAEQ